MNDDVLVHVEGVSKKYCRDLKKSLWYGMKDTASDFVGRDGSKQDLRRGEFWALNDVSLELRRGEFLGLIGRNGAGKTTLLKMLSGLIKPDGGRIEIRGRVGALIALGAGFNPVLTGRENIYVNASILGLSKREINTKIDGIIDFAEIGEFVDSPVQSYSSGMAVRLGFAVAAATEPDVLLLDEVLAVGDVGFQAKCFNALANFRKRGTCFVFVSHNMHMISRYCQKVMYIRHAQVQHYGDVASGIAKFHRDMETSNPKDTVEHPSWTDMVGSGKIRFLGVKFIDAENEVVTEIDVGGAVTLEIEYECCSAEVSNPILDIVIRDGTQVVYQGTNVMSGQVFSKIPKKGKFRIHFDSLPLNVNQIEFFVTILDEETREVFDWKRHIRLSVKRSQPHQGSLVLRPIWSVLN